MLIAIIVGILVFVAGNLFLAAGTAFICALLAGVGVYLMVDDRNGRKR